MLDLDVVLTLGSLFLGGVNAWCLNRCCVNAWRLDWYVVFTLGVLTEGGVHSNPMPNWL